MGSYGGDNEQEKNEPREHCCDGDLWILPEVMLHAV